MFLIGLVLVLLVVFAITKHEEYRIRECHGDVSPKLPLKWHFYKGLYQCIILILIYIAFGIDLACTFTATFIAFHDPWINLKALGKPIDYVGTTSRIDKTLKKIFIEDRNVFIFKILLAIASLVFIWVRRF